MKINKKLFLVGIFVALLIFTQSVFAQDYDELELRLLNNFPKVFNYFLLIHNFIEYDKEIEFRNLRKLIYLQNYKIHLLYKIIKKPTNQRHKMQQ